MKKYIKPSIRVKEVELDASIMAASVKTTGLTDDAPTFGGDNTDDTHEVGAKGFTSSSLWDEE